MKNAIHVTAKVLSVITFCLTVWYGWYAYEIEAGYSIIMGSIYIVSVFAVFIISKLDISKNYKIFIGISMLSLLMLVITSLLYGNDHIFIGNYMPSPEPVYQPPFAIKRMRQMISDMPVIVLIAVSLSVVQIFIMLKKNIIKKSMHGIIIMGLSIIIPIIIAGVKLFLQYSYSV